jgi:hypothetical protein
MTSRFVLDDLPWANQEEDLIEGLDSLCERLDVARVRGEAVSCYAPYEAFRVGRKTLVDLLDPQSLLPRDLRVRLRIHVDRLETLDESSLQAFDVVFDNAEYFAPAVAWAGWNARQGAAVGCLTPSCSLRRGRLHLSILGTTPLLAEVHFVSDEPSHVDFFRTAIVLERADESAFASLAPSAFPDIHFVDGVWRGLRDLSRPYHARRNELIRHLSVVNDHGAAIFALGRNALIQNGFREHGIEISPESHETIADTRCRQERERLFRGESLLFEWHLKIESHVDRIHLHPGTLKSGNRVIVGIIHSHLRLPGD